MQYRFRTCFYNPVPNTSSSNKYNEEKFQNLEFFNSLYKLGRPISLSGKKKTKKK